MAVIKNTYRKSIVVFLVTVALLYQIFAWLNSHSGGARSTFYEMLSRVEATDMRFSSIAALLGLAHEHSVSEVVRKDTFDFFKLVADLPYYSMLKSLIWLSDAQTDGEYDKIENISVDIPLSSLKILSSERKKAIEAGILSDRTWVKGSIRYDGKIYKAKVRLKGDLDDHWRSQTRMSLDIKLKKGSVMNGLRRFSIHAPRVRLYPYGAIFSKIIQDQGGIYAPHFLAKVKVNGSDWGVMDIEEKVGVDLLERQQRKASTVISFGDDKYFLTTPEAGAGGIEYYRGHPSFSVDLESSSKKNYSNIDRAQYGFIIKRHLLDQKEMLVDFKKTAQELATTLIWGGAHHSGTLNKKHYLNPYSLLLEPISGDVDPPKKLSSIEDISKIYLSFDCKCNPEFKYRLLVESLDILSKDNNFLKISEIEADRLSRIFINDKQYDISMLHSNLKWIKENRDAIFDKKTLEKEEYFEKIHRVSNSKLNDKNFKPVDIYHYDSGKILIVNLTSLDFQINKVTDLSTGKSIDLYIELPASSIKNVSTQVLDTNIKGFKDSQIKVSLQSKKSIHEAISGFSLSDLKDDEYRLDRFHNQVLSESIKEELNSEVHRFSEDKTIDGIEIYEGKLVINPGVKVNIKEKGALVVVGDIVAKADQENPISISGNNLSGSIYIYGGRDGSIFDNVDFSDMGALSNNVLNLTGAVTVFNSSIVIKNSTFRNFSSEDAINVIHSNANFSNVYIEKVASDAVDFDFSTGEIENLSIDGSNGDGLDFSGSIFDLKDVSCASVKDKCISAGEASKLNIDTLSVKNSGVGVASKDGSNVVVRNPSISNITLHSFMSYRKKPIYRGAKLYVYDKSDREFSAVNQHGSFLKYNDTEIEGVSIDIDNLYSSSVMKK